MHHSDVESFLAVEQVLTDNSDTPFEHLQPEEAADDSKWPVHPFQHRIMQLDDAPPDHVLSRSAVSSPLHAAFSRTPSSTAGTDDTLWSQTPAAYWVLCSGYVFLQTQKQRNACHWSMQGNGHASCSGALPVPVDLNPP